MEYNGTKRMEMEKCYEFVGEYFFSVDEKFRVAVPSSFRKVISEEPNQTLFLFPGPYKTILVFTHFFWREFWDRLEKLYNPRGLLLNFDLLRLSKNTWNVRMDSLGRILINEPLRKYTGITAGSEVVILGYTNFFIIAPRKYYDEKIGKDSEEKVWQVLGMEEDLAKERSSSNGENESNRLNPTG